MGLCHPRPLMFFNPGLLPGAILLGLLLAAQLLEKGPVLPGEQSRAAAPARNEPIRPPVPSKNSRNEVATHPVPTMAHTH